MNSVYVIYGKTYISLDFLYTLIFFNSLDVDVLVWVVLLMFLGDNGSEWMKHWVKGGHNYYYNLKTEQGTWDEPPDLVSNNTQLNKEEIQVHLQTCMHIYVYSFNRRFLLTN